MGALTTCLAIFCMAPFPLADSAFQDRASVYGTVMNRDNNQPIPGAIVLADGWPSVGFENATTDADGRFFLFMLLPGHYGFDAAKTGYHDCSVADETQRDLEAGLQYGVTIWLSKKCE